MEHVYIVVAGLFALVLLVMIATIAFHKKAIYLANLIMSLAFFMARSCFIYFINPINNQATRENQEQLNFVRGLLPWLLGWVVLSALAVLAFNVLIPFIHNHYTILRTPAGEKDRVIKKIQDYRRSA